MGLNIFVFCVTMSDPTLTVAAARDFILEHCPKPTATENIVLTEALNRVVAADVESNVQIPSCNNSAMDGYAFRWADIENSDTVELPVMGESLAGHPLKTVECSTPCAVRITTGAYVPDGFDTVIAYEKTTLNDNAVCFQKSAVQKGANVRIAGEEIERTDVVLSAGTRLGPAHIALLAGIGCDHVRVFAPLRVAVLITGDELVEPGQTIEEGAVYNSNGPALTSLLTRLGCQVHCPGIVPDDPEAIDAALKQAKESCDMILMTGGAAKSQADHSHRQLAKLGELYDWTVNMRPGRPMRFGRIADKPVFVLPGNPVASMITFVEFVRGAICHMQGIQTEVWPRGFRAIAAEDITAKSGRAEFMRARVTAFSQGAAVVAPLANQSSASLTSMCQAHVLIAIDHDTDEIKKGQKVTIHLLNEVL